MTASATAVRITRDVEVSGLTAVRCVPECEHDE